MPRRGTHAPARAPREEHAADGRGRRKGSDLARGWPGLDVGVPVWIPPVELCTDNAAMIAGAARFLEALPYPDYLGLDASARVAGRSPTQ